ncbi:hypothetical protein [Sphingobacterium thalpophilum]|uniref:hypothetical protein n=1 Tax=Sphingobacterium thalpophilum TaxID=259 RepID=UPI0024A6C455|nr:hypothetical protein [Sphingobacterium thalpophilum]
MGFKKIEARLARLCHRASYAATIEEAIASSPVSIVIVHDYAVLNNSTCPRVQRGTGTIVGRN